MEFSVITKTVQVSNFTHLTSVLFCKPESFRLYKTARQITTQNSLYETNLKADASPTRYIQPNSQSLYSNPAFLDKAPPSLGSINSFCELSLGTLSYFPLSPYNIFERQLTAGPDRENLVQHALTTKPILYHLLTATSAPNAPPGPLPSS